MRHAAEAPAPLVALWRTVARGRPFAPGITLGEAEVAWAIEAGMGPLLHDAARGTRGLVPEALASRLQVADRLARLRSVDMLEATAAIVDRCTGRAAPLTLLKGISICGQYYPLPHQRFLSDLDLLVHPEDATAVSAALAELGYRVPEAAARLDYRAHHHLPPVRHPDTGICAELHTGLFPPGEELVRRGPFDLATLCEERRPSTLDGRPVFRLSPELQVLYIASHWALDFVPAAGARALLDMTLLLRAESDRLDWARIHGWLENRRVAAHLQLMLHYLETRELVELPAALRADWSRKPPLDRGALRVLCAMVERYQVRGMMRGVPQIPRAQPHDAPAAAAAQPTWRSRVGTLRSVVRGRSPSSLLLMIDDLAWERLLNHPRHSGSRVLLQWCRLFPPGDPHRFRPGHRLRSLAARRGRRRTAGAALPDGERW